jgi:cobalt-zinc-cadmium efflux system membrane fusion protein
MEAQEFERGPHNGRLLRDGDFSLEITIFETGVPPEFRIYPFKQDQALPPGDVDVKVQLRRLGNRVDEFEFQAQGDLLRGSGVVFEPHSFAVTVTATYAGRQMTWSYDSFEGRTKIEPEVAEAMGVDVAQATGQTIYETIELLGTVLPDPNAVSEIHGRFPGLVQSLQKEVGDRVQRGETLATVLSNESLQTYTVTAARDGTVIARNATVGSALNEDALYRVADLSQLIVDFKIYARDLDRVAVGQTVIVTSLDGAIETTAIVERILPSLDASNQAATARVRLPQADTLWRPAQFVRGKLVVAEHAVALAVRESGLQSFRDFTVVYAKVDDTYEVRMLDLGRRDGEYVEVVGGLEAGTIYVTANSYLVKADIEKSGASHDH